MMNVILKGVSPFRVSGTFVLISSKCPISAGDINAPRLSVASVSNNVKHMV